MNGRNAVCYRNQPTRLSLFILVDIDLIFGTDIIFFISPLEHVSLRIHDFDIRSTYFRDVSADRRNLFDNINRANELITLTFSRRSKSQGFFSTRLHETISRDASA